MHAFEDRFAACAASVMTDHGSFQSHDPLFDGPSAHGIGLGLLSIWIGGPADAALLRGLEPEAATHILRSMVWAPLGAARLPPGVDQALFAYALEAGTIRAMADLQAELGVPGSGTTDAATITAVAARRPASLAAALRAAHAGWRRDRGLPARRRQRRTRAQPEPCMA